MRLPFILRTTGLVSGFLGHKFPIFVLTPYAKSLGNCMQDFYFGLLKARRENKKLLLLVPHEILPARFRSGLVNSEMLNIDSPFTRFTGRRALQFIGGWLLTLFFSFSAILYLGWRKFLGFWAKIRPKYRLPELNVRYLIPALGRASLWKPAKITRFSWDFVDTQQWSLEYHQYLPVGLEPKRYRVAESLRIRMGIPLTDWFVCLHVREGGFRGDYVDVRWRNASIENYILGICEVVNRGGWVVRLGDASMTRLPSMDRVIDYPFTPFKSALMDLYLTSQCRFFIGTNSGPYDMATLFQKRALLVNVSEWAQTYPLRKGDLMILKHVFSKSRNRLLSLQELLEEPFECQGGFQFSIGRNYVMQENTSEEIRDLIEEGLTMPPETPHSDLQRFFSEGRVRQIKRWLKEEANNPVYCLDVEEKYHIAARSAAAGGTLGRKYLEKNWQVDSLNKSTTQASISVSSL